MSIENYLPLGGINPAHVSFIRFNIPSLTTGYCNITLPSYAYQDEGQVMRYPKESNRMEATKTSMTPGCKQ